MHNYRITLQNGYQWITAFNGTFSEAKAYFLGMDVCYQSGEIDGIWREKFSRCVKVEYKGV